MATLTDYPDDWEETFLSNPNFSMVEYTRRVDEYQRLLKEKQDAADASGMSGGSEGGGALEAGSDVTYGGGPLWDKYGNEQEATNTGANVVGGNRDMGRTFVKGLSNLTNTGMFGVVNAINNQLNKNKNQTAVTGLLGYNLGDQGPAGTTASGTAANPVSTEQGILDMMRQAAEQGGDQGLGTGFTDADLGTVANWGY